MIASLERRHRPQAGPTTRAAMQDAGAAAIELNIYYLPGDVADARARRGAATRGRPAARSRTPVSVPGRGQAQPVLQLDGRDRRAAGPRPAPTHSSSSTGSCSRTSTPRSSRSSTRSVSRARPRLRLPRTWIALLHGRVRASLAATTGVETSADVAKYLLAGADVVMTASALLRHGPEHATVLLDGLTEWMERKGFTGVDGCPRPTRGAARHGRGGVRASRVRRCTFARRTAAVTTPAQAESPSSGLSDNDLVQVSSALWSGLLCGRRAATFARVGPAGIRTGY